MLRLWTRSLRRTTDGTWILRHQRYGCGFGLISIQRLGKCIFDRVMVHRPGLPPLHVTLHDVSSFSHIIFFHEQDALWFVDWAFSDRSHLQVQAVHWFYSWTSGTRLFSTPVMSLSANWYIILFCLVMNERYVLILCNTVVDTGPWTGLRCNVCIGCCVGRETRGWRWNGGALCNVAMERRSFGAERGSITVLSLSLTPHLHTHTHSLVHVDAGTCLLKSCSQSHSHLLRMQTPSGRRWLQTSTFFVHRFHSNI